MDCFCQIDAGGGTACIGVSHARSEYAESVVSRATGVQIGAVPVGIGRLFRRETESQRRRRLFLSLREIDIRLPYERIYFMIQPVIYNKMIAFREIHRYRMGRLVNRYFMIIERKEIRQPAGLFRRQRRLLFDRLFRVFCAVRFTRRVCIRRDRDRVGCRLDRTAFLLRSLRDRVRHRLTRFVRYRRPRGQNQTGQNHCQRETKRRYAFRKLAFHLIFSFHHNLIKGHDFT